MQGLQPDGDWRRSRGGERILKRNYKPGFRTALYAKDYRNVAAALSEYNSPAPVSVVIQQLVNAMMAKGQGEEDYSALATVLFDLAGLQDEQTADRRPPAGT